jgi:hypothetical protein
LCTPRLSKFLYRLPKVHVAPGLTQVSSPRGRRSQGPVRNLGAVLLSHSPPWGVRALTWRKGARALNGGRARFPLTNWGIRSLRSLAVWSHFTKPKGVPGSYRRDGRAKSAQKRDKASMFPNRSCDSARSSAPCFLLGAGCAALLVLSFAGASLALSRGSGEAWKPGMNELRLGRVPHPEPTLGGLA